jgi:hypothetical protein
MLRLPASLVAPLPGLFVIALLATPASSAVVFLSGAACGANDQVDVSWTFDDDPSNPVQLPQWIGYDVWRADAADCKGSVLLNSEPIPRTPGPHSEGVWHDATALPGTSYLYQIIPVDANRIQVVIPGCECSLAAWSNCPATTAALQGTIAQDWGFALAIQACPGSCWPGVYFEDAEMIAQLRPFVGTGTTFDFFGTIGCGSVEGCFLAIEGYQEAACGPTPADATSWGHLKAIYR